LILLVLSIIDIGPVPVLGFALLSIVLYRPLWFKQAVDRLYAKK